MLDLISYPQWVCWRWKGTRKPPFNPNTGKPADISDPATWSTFDVAVDAQKFYRYDGVGFVFTPSDPFCGVDLDDCLHDGVFTAVAQSVLAAIPTYTEISPSGTGIKLFCRGSLTTATTMRGVEVYDRHRFFTVTGKRLANTPSTCTDAQAQIDRLVAWIQRKQQPTPAPEALPRGGHASHGGGNSPYATAALQREIARLKNASDGDRNNMLNRVAFSLGTLVGAGELDEHSTATTLHHTAIDLGLTAAESKATIRSGLRAGMQRPRRVEAPRKPD